MSHLSLKFNLHDLKRTFKKIIGRQKIKNSNVTLIHTENFDYNKHFWDKYAKEWDKSSVALDNTNVTNEERNSYLKYLGDEWGYPKDILEIIQDYIYPYVDTNKVVAEIGVGGGRIASKVVDRVKELYCFDISKEMLSLAKNTLTNKSNVDFILLEQPKFPDQYNNKFDFVYSFDVFVHLDLHMQKKYFYEINKILKNGEYAFIHTSNLKAPNGWKSFAAQDKYIVDLHYFISPEIVEILASHSGLTITKTSAPKKDNFYLNRDYLFILQKTSSLIDIQKNSSDS